MAVHCTTTTWVSSSSESTTPIKCWTRPGAWCQPNGTCIRGARRRDADRPRHRRREAHAPIAMAQVYFGTPYPTVVSLSATGGTQWPLATYGPPSLEPFSSIGSSTHQPLATCMAILTSLLTLPFLWEVLPTEPPDCPCFTALCRIHPDEGNCPHHWPSASKSTPHTSGGGPLPNGGFGAQDVHLRGHFP